MKQKITLIKLGGSVITNKEVPMMVREHVLEQLVDEICSAQKKTGELYIVGHGQGSFAHAPALRYKTMQGFISDESRVGMAITQDSAAQLNRIVVTAFLAAGMPAVSCNFSQTLVTEHGAPKHWCGQVLDEYLEKGLFPVTCGDVIVDAVQGCTIWSTEKILAHIAEHYSNSKNYQVHRLLHVTEVAGVLDSAGTVIPLINKKNLPEIKNMITATKGFDVTGGMLHKLEESMQLAVTGIQTGIVSGLEKGLLYKTLTSGKILGTTIEV